MSRRLLLPAVFAAALTPWAVGPSGVSAQDKAEVEVKKIAVPTFDGATIQGRLYKSVKGSNSPTAILLHSYGTDPTKGDWGGLATLLAKEGYNAFRFDFRGHGDSTIVNPNKFWNDPFQFNQTAMKRLALKRPPADQISYKEFPKSGSYFPRLADDIMSARVALDQLNDNAEVNTRSVYLIGATDAVYTGFLYMAAEQVRPQKLPPNLPNNQQVLTPGRFGLANQLGIDPAGLDLAGAVWLSPPKGVPGMSPRQLQGWLAEAPDLRTRTHMLFVSGDEDALGRAGSSFFLNEVLIATPPGGSRLAKLPLTYSRTIKGSKKLAGVGLLGQQLGTEKMIVDYLNTVEKERANLIRVVGRGYTSPIPINLPAYGFTPR